jgi:hypothetical protein
LNSPKEANTLKSLICYARSTRQPYYLPIILFAQPRVEPNTYLMAGRRANHLATPHPNLATPHSFLSLYNDVFWKENEIPGHFAIAFNSANNSVSS